MASNFIKALLLLLSFSVIADDGHDPEYLRYLEEVNYRLNNLNLLARNEKLLAQIVVELRIIRCQTEVSEVCDQINSKEDSE